MLLEEVGGEESEYESDLEELATPEENKYKHSPKSSQKIFKYLKI